MKIFAMVKQITENIKSGWYRYLGTYYIIVVAYYILLLLLLLLLLIVSTYYYILLQAGYLPN